MIADDDRVEEPRPALAWTWDDLGYPSGAFFGALNVGENEMIVRMPWATPRTAGAALGRPRPHSIVRSPNRTTHGRARHGGRIWRRAAARRAVPDDRGLGARARHGEVQLSVSVGNPTLWFAKRLRAALVATGIEVVGEAFDVDDIRPRPELTAATLVHGHVSPPLSTLVRPMLKNSINLHGEALLRVNAALDGVPTNDAALDGLRRRLTAWGDACGRRAGGGRLRACRAAASMTADALTLILQRMQGLRREVAVRERACLWPASMARWLGA